MKKIALFIILSLIIIFSDISESFAQSLLQKANTAFNEKDYYTSLLLYKKALKNERDITNIKYIYFKIAESFRYGNHFSEALEWYKEAINQGYNDTSIYYNYADILIKNCIYDEARTYLEKYLIIKPDDKKAQKKLESIEYVQKIRLTHSIYEINNMQELNSSYSDFGVIYFNDKLVFASSRFIKNDSGKTYYTYTGQGFSDFYESTYDNKISTWQTPVKINGGINSKYNDGSIFYDKKNNIAYFMQCNGFKGNKENCNIFCSSYDNTNNKWTDAIIFEYNNAQYSSGHPALSSDGKTMYFVSDMPGGYGGKDIWIIKKDNENKWGTPVNIGAPINTDGNEMFPYIYNDTLLYYSSDGNIGFGGLDLFYSSIKNNSFSTPINLGTPFNSCSDDFGIIFKDRNSGIFCSNRQGGLGDDDIYSFKLSPVILRASGLITDKETMQVIENAVVVLKGSDGSIDSTLSDATGHYLFNNLNPNVKYVINTSKASYSSYSKTFSTSDEKYSKDFLKNSGYDLDFELTKEPVFSQNDEISIPDIYYDFDKWDLKPISKVSLDKIVKMLNDHPEMKIRINSHTDERGTNSYNDQLSENRAQSVVNYLIEKGIDQNRLSFKGWGELHPIKPNAQTEEDHQLNRRTTFTIVSNSDKESSTYHKAQLMEIEDNKKQELSNTTNDNNSTQEKDITSKNLLLKDSVLYKVQFLASKTPIDKSYYKKIEDNIPEFKIEYTKNKDGVIRYTIGSFNDYNSSIQLKERLVKLGYASFIVAFKGDKRITFTDQNDLLKKLKSNQ